MKTKKLFAKIWDSISLGLIWILMILVKGTQKISKAPRHIMTVCIKFGPPIILGLFIWFLIVLFSSCTKEYTVMIQDNKPYVENYYSAPTSDCPGGVYNLNYYEDSTLIFHDEVCLQNSGDTIIIPSLPESSLWDYIRGECDTIINYFERNNIPGYSFGDSINFKIVICDKITIIRDTLFVHDTTTIYEQLPPIHDTITIVDTVNYTDTIQVVVEKDFILTRYQEKCNSGSSPAAVERGWYVEGEEYLGPYSLNYINSKTGEGSLVYWDYWLPSKIIWCPEFEKPSGIKKVNFKIGSNRFTKVHLYLMYSNGSISKQIKEVHFSSTPDFQWDNSESYKQEFVFNPRISEINSFDVVRWGIAIELLDIFGIPECDQLYDKSCPWRNEVPNVIEIEWETISPIE